MDTAAAALYSRSHVEQLSASLQSELLSNPHSGGLSGLASLDTRNELVNQLRDLWSIGDEYEIIFTSNSTHGIKLGAEILSFTSDDLLVLTKDNHTSMAGMRRMAILAGASVLVYDDERFHGEFTKEVKRIIYCWPKQSNFNGRLYDDSFGTFLHDKTVKTFNCSNSVRAIYFNGKLRFGFTF